MLDNDTICAISTAPGMGAIAVIRLSGKESIAICDRVFESPAKGKRLLDQAANTVHFGVLVDKGDVVDEVLVALFRAPYSYTGEEVVEVSCHGSVFIQQRVLQLFVDAGARLATAGEFTTRAFLNGKLDLAQAEAVADLIASDSSASHRVAMQQMRGGVSAEIGVLREQLLNFISLIELELDFSEEDVQFADRTQLGALVDVIRTVLEKLIASFQLGNAIKNGVPVSIVGEPNVGKSTLLNLLLNEDRAIVSDIAGTTRDVIEDTMVINGITFRFIDTAGIRETTDRIESLGIERTHAKIGQSAIVLLLVDVLDGQAGDKVRQIAERMDLTEQRLVVVVNKVDKVHGGQALSSLGLVTELSFAVVEIAAKTGLCLDVLQEQLLDTVNLGRLNMGDVILTNARHVEALKGALEALDMAAEGMVTELSSDFLAMDIRRALHYLGLITGEITTDEVLGNIFGKFCIGK